MNTYVIDFFENSPLVTAVIAWFAAQLIKVLLVLKKDKKIDFSRFVGAGGMPSSHSALVCSMSCAVGIVDGFSSPSFAIAAVLALVVMYDAAGVRRAAGQQAKILNQLIENYGTDSQKDREKKLKELLGHTPKEVVAGAMLGIIIGILRHI